MGEEINIKMDSIFVFPHVRYIAVENNTNPHYRYKKYIGNHESLTNGKVYEFHQVMYSPNRETTRRKVWVTKTDIGPYVRYENTKNEWVNVKKSNI
jgi:hypothetical protein